MSQEAYAIKNDKNYLSEVERYVKGIKYGSVTLIVQDGKVIQIDKTEKIRMKNWKDQRFYGINRERKIPGLFFCSESKNEMP